MNYGERFKMAVEAGHEQEALLHKKRFIENELLDCIRIAAPEIIDITFSPKTKRVKVKYDDEYVDMVEVGGLDLNETMRTVTQNLKI